MLNTVGARIASESASGFQAPAPLDKDWGVRDFNTGGRADRKRSRVNLSFNLPQVIRRLESDLKHGWIADRQQWRLQVPPGGIICRVFCWRYSCSCSWSKSRSQPFPKLNWKSHCRDDSYQARPTSLLHRDPCIAPPVSW